MSSYAFKQKCFLYIHAVLKLSMLVVDRKDAKYKYVHHLNTGVSNFLMHVLQTSDEPKSPPIKYVS